LSSAGRRSAPKPARIPSVDMNAGEPYVLLVDDSAVEAELSLVALRHHVAIALRVAATVREAAQAVAASHPRLVLLDLKLQGESGLDLLVQLKRDATTATIPVVMLSSSRHPHDLRESYRLGANGYVVKPVDFDAFREVARKVADFWLTVNQLPD
jgi:two-component system response regulator